MTPSTEERFNQLEGQMAATQRQLAESHAELRLQSEQIAKVLRLLRPAAASEAQAIPAGAPDATSSPEQIPSPVSRRSMLKKAALATLGATAMWETMPSAKADGSSDLILGSTNSATATTSLTTTSGYGLSATGPNAGLYGTSDSGYGVEAYSMTGTAVHGRSGSGSGVYAFAFNSAGTSPGVYAFANFGSGVDASSEYGAGVSTSSSAGTGITASGGSYGASLTGALAPLFLAGSSLDSPYADTSGKTHEVGEVFVDSTGGLWYCVTQGAPGFWSRLATSVPAGSVTSGNYVRFSAPTRFIDTRPSSASYTPDATAPAPGGGVKSYIFSGSNALTAYASSGTPPAIPYGANTLVGRVTVLSGENGSSVGGQLKVSNVNPPGFGSGLIIWGTTKATQIAPFVLSLDNASTSGSGQMYFVNSSTSDTIDIIVDVTGYYY